MAGAEREASGHYEAVQRDVAAKEMRGSEVGDEWAEDDGVDALADREHGCDAGQERGRPSSEWISVADKTPRSAIAQSALASANTRARRR